MWQVLILTSTFTFSEQSSAQLHWQRHQFKWKDIVAIRTYVTRKVYFHSLIRTQLRLSNLSADRSLVKVWGLSPLGAIVGGEVEKPVGCNWPSPRVMKCQLLHWIARITARWQRPKAGRPMVTGLDGCTSWILWFWYTIRCMRARLERVESGVDEDIYLV